MDELIDVLKKFYSPAEIVEILKRYDREKLKEYARENQICFNCCYKLKIYTWKEDKGEHFGFPAWEEMSELKCEICGWS